MAFRFHPMKLVGATALAAVLLAAPASAADSVADFYKGNTLTIMLGHPPGGSYDLYARLAANHIKKYIPGNPNVIVEHRPGGGGVRAVLYFYSQAARDGSVIGLFPETIAHTQLLQPEIGKWNVSEMAYIGSFTPVNAAFVMRKGAPAKSVADLKKVETSVGCTGRNSQSYQSPAMLNNLGGFKFKIICGYRGSAASILALTKGEVDIVSSAWNTWHAKHSGEIKNGDLIPIIQVGLRRNKEIANVPLMQEVVDDPTAKKVIEFFSAGSSIGRALIAPPKVPVERLAVLRKAFDQLVKDPEFLASAKKARAEVDPTPGAEVQKDALLILDAPKDIIAKATKAMK